jgi:hypothetical protein
MEIKRRNDGRDFYAEWCDAETWKHGKYVMHAAVLIHTAIASSSQTKRYLHMHAAVQCRTGKEECTFCVPVNS